MILVTKFAQKLAQIAAALGKYLPATSKIVLAGTTYTGAQLVQLFQSALTALQAVAAAESSLAQARKSAQAQEADAHVVYVQLGEALRAQFGKGSPLLTELGFSTGARSKPSPEKLVASRKQAKATREARHTLGKKQKAKITAPATPPAPVTGGSGTPPGASGTGPA